MLRYLTLSAALLIGKAYLFECTPYEPNFCTEMTGIPSYCKANPNGDNYICFGKSDDKEIMSIYQAKPRLMAFIP